MTKRIAVIAMAMALSVAGVWHVNAVDDIRAQIDKANLVFETAFAKGDAMGVANCYTADGMLLPPGAASITGIPDIAAFWDGGMKGGIAKIDLITLEAEQHGDTAIEVGRAELFGKNGSLLDNAKFVVIWKRVDGVWKLHRDIFNSSGEA